MHYSIRYIKHSIESLLRCYGLRDHIYNKSGVNKAIRLPRIVQGGENIIIEGNSYIYGDSLILAAKGKFILNKNSGIAARLSADPDNHIYQVGEKVGGKGNNNLEPGLIEIDEDVWIGMNVTLLSGTRIGRGAIVGGGTVLRDAKIPPYAIVVGNPGKVVGFRYTPDEIIKHEELNYKPEDRLDISLLEKNYDKYFISRIKQIREFLSIKL